MAKLGIRYWYVVILLCFSSPAAQARVISLASETQAVVRGDTLEISVKVTNQGDEPAYHLQLKTEIQNSSKESAVQAPLAVGKSDSFSHQYRLAGVLPGRYPIVVRFFYADANSYPLSAMAVSSFSTGHDLIPEVVGIVENFDINSAARLKLKLKNLEGRRKDLQIRLVLPQEFSVDHSTTQITLGSQEEKVITFPLRNFSALNDSRYPVYALIEYDQDGVHTVALASGIVHVLTNTASAFSKIALPVFVSLIILFIGFNVGYLRKRR